MTDDESKRRRDWNAGFRPLFKDAFKGAFGIPVQWLHGQIAGNTAHLPFQPELKRPGKKRHTGEVFELGDLRADIKGWTVIVEYDSGAVPIHNLAKYWPFIRGELLQVDGVRLEPTLPILFCHFSSYQSYATYRHLWDWTLRMMQSDRAAKVQIHGKQFDHKGDEIDAPARPEAILESIAWLKQYVV
jgi:hypothetical protein